MIRTFILTLALGVLPIRGNATLGRAEVPDVKSQATESHANPKEAEQPEVLSTSPLLEKPIDPASYVLGPSDELMLIVRGADTKAFDLRVYPEGNVILPNVGAFRAAGLTLADFRARVREVLARYYRNTEIDCQLTLPRKFLVFVLGAVAKPGRVELTAPFRVSQALRAAGGVGPNGSERRIEIIEDGQTVRTVDHFSFLKFGDFEQNPMLNEGQSVYVPVRLAQVQLIGEVRVPGTYEILPGETVADLLRFGGGLDTQADGDHLMLERSVPGRSSETLAFTQADAPKYPLEDTDIVVVRDAMSFDGNQPVEVVGGGGRTGAFETDRPERLVDFLSRIWRFTPEFDTHTAVLERKASDGKIEYHPFDITRVLAGDPAGGMEVKPGDIISIPPRDTYVFVTGEIVKPGGVPFSPGLSAERYLALAGGATNSGSVNKLTIYSRDGVQRKGDRNSEVYRGDTIVVGRKNSKIFGSLFVGITSMTGLLLSVYAITK
jgi:protein involved in polysaccharide export with SLBB domain